MKNENNKDIVVSGVRSTGLLHLGNYFGAIKQYVEMQDKYNCFYFVADYHTLTTHPNPQNLFNDSRNVLIDFLACGIDPDKCTLYIQSDVPQIAELYLFLNMHAYVGELNRTTTFKEKSHQSPDNINAGLLTYPTLMAADILIHKGTKVPVGKDQEQHLEMARVFAGRFNEKYNKEIFPKPMAFNMGNDLIKIPGLDGSGKMGKSDGNAIYLRDEPELIRKKVMKAVTDSGKSEIKIIPIENLFTLMKFVSNSDVFNFFENKYIDGSIKYSDMKNQIADDIIKLTSPIKDKIEIVSGDENYINRVIKIGKEKAISSAEKTIKEVRQSIGFKN